MLGERLSWIGSDLGRNCVCYLSDCRAAFGIIKTTIGQFDLMFSRLNPGIRMKSEVRLGRLIVIPLLSLISVAAGAKPPGPTPAALVVTTLAQRTKASLPDQPLYWQVERFADAVAAAQGASPEALFVENVGETWRFTLAPKQPVQSAGQFVASVGPVPKPAATTYLLRINRAVGPPGAITAVHTHPGSEAFFVLAGRMCQRTDLGVTQLDAGHSLNGTMPGMAMQIKSCGDAPLDQFVMFVVDAEKPFSTAAAFKVK